MNRKILSVIIISITISLLSIYDFFQKEKKEKLLEKGKQTFGVVISRNEMAVHGSPSINVRYQVKGINYSFKEYGGFPSVNPGDTLLIKYSLEDYSVAEVAGKYDK